MDNERKMKSPIYFRTKLLVAIIDMDLSESTAKTITDFVMKSAEDYKEDVAASLLGLLKECNNEKEVIKALTIKEVDVSSER